MGWKRTKNSKKMIGGKPKRKSKSKKKKELMSLISSDSTGSIQLSYDYVKSIIDKHKLLYEKEAMPIELKIKLKQVNTNKKMMDGDINDAVIAANDYLKFATQISQDYKIADIKSYVKKHLKAAKGLNLPLTFLYDTLKSNIDDKDWMTPNLHELDIWLYKEYKLKTKFFKHIFKKFNEKVKSQKNIIHPKVFFEYVSEKVEAYRKKMFILLDPTDWESMNYNKLKSHQKELFFNIVPPSFGDDILTKKK